MDPFPLVHPHCLSLVPWPGPDPTPQACTLTGNQIGNLVLCGTMPSPLSHTGQGQPFCFLGFYNSHQPGPSKSQSDLHQEGATWVRQGKHLWATCEHPETTKDVCRLSSSQCLCHYHPLELPADDAGVEERRLSGSRQYLSAQASAGKPRGRRWVYLTLSCLLKIRDIHALYYFATLL